MGWVDGPVYLDIVDVVLCLAGCQVDTSAGGAGADLAGRAPEECVYCLPAAAAAQHRGKWQLSDVRLAHSLDNMHLSTHADTFASHPKLRMCMQLLPT